MPKGRPKKVKPEVKEEYTAIINVLGRNYTATGATIKDAILGLNPGRCKGRGILSILKGDVRKERILMPPVVFRLFNSGGIMREVAIKNASLLF